MTLRLDRFCNYIYTWCVNRMSDQDRQDFDAQIRMPITGDSQTPRHHRPSPADLESEGTDFMKFMGQVSAR